MKTLHKKLLCKIGIGVVLILIVAVLLSLTRDRKLRLADERISRDVERIVIEDLRNQPADSGVTLRYGKFKNFTDVSWHRSSKPPIQKVKYVEHITWRGVAQFEKAMALVSIRVDRGPSLLLEQFEMIPSEDWRLKNSAEIMLGEEGLLHVTTDPQSGYSVSHFEGRVRHLDFVSKDK